MTDSIDIRSLPGGGVYQLCLPEQLSNTLRLTKADGNALSIVHENKMQLEWLAQRIMKQYQAFNNALTAGKAKLKRKKRLAFIILGISLLTGLFSSGIAKLAHINILYTYTFIFTVGIISGLQLLKYFAMGFTLSEGDVNSDLHISGLKDLILKDFSPEDYLRS